MRATRESNSRSQMSLTTQPAARMTTAPAANSASRPGSGQDGEASAADHQQGHISSQKPTGRSARASFSQGLAAGGARLSIQLPRSALSPPSVMW